jgi:hypothetical protein
VEALNHFPAFCVHAAWQMSGNEQNKTAIMHSVTAVLYVLQAIDIRLNEVSSARPLQQC